jgi:rRNA biogenesis protein RRP5
VVEPITNRVILTAKKSLVESKRAILHSFSDARIGLVTDAVVYKVSEKGLVVEFYNNLKAFAPRNEIV